MADTDMLLGELKAELRALREEVAETKRELRDSVVDAKRAAVEARQQAQATAEHFAAMKNRGYGFLAGLTLLAGAAGAKIHAVIFGS